MTPEQFVRLAKDQRDQVFTMCFDPRSTSAVASQIAAMRLDADREAALKRAVAGLLDDVFYTWLLALDGAAPLGGTQRNYTLTDEDGSRLTDDGAIEAAAYEAFHGDGPGEG